MLGAASRVYGMGKVYGRQPDQSDDAGGPPEPEPPLDSGPIASPEAAAELTRDEAASMPVRAQHRPTVGAGAS